MSEHNELQDLEHFRTGIAVAPLPPSEVRRLGDRRRAHRRYATLVAASVVAVLAIGIPVALTRGGEDADGNGSIAVTPSPTANPTASPTSSPTASPTATSTPQVITYPGTGVEVSTAADVDDLSGTSQEFKDFIADQARRANDDGASCPDAAHGVTVQKYSSAGYALGGVNSCGGYAALWAVHEDHWIEGSGTQDAWDCDTLGYLGVPTSFAGGCADEAGGFGPDEVNGLKLGMTEAQIEAAGGSVDPGSAGMCRGLLLPYTSPVPDHVDGWFSPGDGLVMIAARPGMKTPERIGLGSSRAAVEAAYPGGSLSNGYWVAPLGGGTEYEFGIEQDGTVGEVLLTRSSQNCTN